MPHSLEGTRKLFREIFHETSSGDFGIQIKDGPLFRCHTHILENAGGFIGKVREFGKASNRTVDSYEIVQTKDFFKENGYTRLMEDLTAIQFSQPIERSALMGPAAKIKGGERGEDPHKPGFSTKHFLGGETCAVKRRDPFFLAERYTVDCDCERMAELLRFVYQGEMSFFDLRPKSDTEREVLVHKMLHMCIDAEKYSVDALYEKLLVWLGKDAYSVVGERYFADAFYYLQHCERNVTEEHSRQALVAVVTGDMLATRLQFKAVTRDPRWSSLPCDFVENTLKFDNMPIGSETEVLNLIERWNANADKKKEEIVRLLGCFRPDEETKGVFCSWVTNMGWLNSDGSIPDLPELSGLKSILSGQQNKGRKPRRNLRASDPDEDGDATQEGGEETTFVHYQGVNPVASGCSFTVGAQQRLVQAEPIRSAGLSRIRVVLSNPRKTLWDPEHEVFVGMSYGEGRYFGYLCSATAFSGIFSARALASAAPAPSAPVHLTGSGNKVEFDMGLEVQLQRANLVVVCKLSVIFANETVTVEEFQISYETLTAGPGLRFQAVATGLADEEVDIQLAWVGGGGPTQEKELVYDSLDFDESYGGGAHRDAYQSQSWNQTTY